MRRGCVDAAAAGWRWFCRFVIHRTPGAAGIRQDPYSAALTLPRPAADFFTVRGLP